MPLRDFPWWTPDAVKFVDGLLTKDFEVLEFGCGGSTPWLCKRAKSVITVEHNPKWYDIVKRENIINLDIHLLDRPYNNFTEKFPDNYFDFIIVDGRDRVKCFGDSIRILKPGCWIGLDDASRERYSEAWKLVDNWEKYKTVNKDPRKAKTGSLVTWFWKKP